MNALDLAEKRVKLRKVSGTNGGEWQGPCPGCGGDDRFHVWPVQNEGRGAYWCRGCEKSGDNIQFLRDYEGMTIQDACAYLNVSLPDHRERPGHPPPQHTKPVFQPVSHASPADLWQEKAEKFITWASANLSKNNEVSIWLADRGIPPWTAVNFRLGWNVGEEGKDIYRPRKAWGLPEILKDDGRPKALWIPRGLVIPYIVDGVVYRIRIRRPEGEPRYYVLPGSAMSTMMIGRERRAFVVVESELDAIAVAASSDLAGAVAVGSVSAKPDAETFAVLKKSLQILNALDYDAAGAKAMEWWGDNFAHHDRWPVPKGKDPGEAVCMGIDLNQWIIAGLPPALTMMSEAGGKTGADEWGRRAKAGDIPSDGDKTPAPPSNKECDPGAGATMDFAPPVLELLMLLRKNPCVKIINTPDRYTVLRSGKYVGGRINELVFKTPEVLDYISNHPANEIDAGNLII
jgi:DNA primase